MNDSAQIVCFPVIIIAGIFLSRKWPRPMRWASRCLAVANGLALLCIVATGWLDRAALFIAIHGPLAHGLLVLDWNAIPLARGETAFGPLVRIGISKSWSSWPRKRVCRSRGLI
jgi:amino acid transporter